MRLLIFGKNQRVFKFFIDRFYKDLVVDVTNSKEDLLDKFYLYDYDLILLDLSSGIDFSAVIIEIRSDKQFLPIMCLLEKDHCSNLEKLLKLQINYLLWKPLLANNSALITFYSLTFDQSKNTFLVKDESLNLSKREHLLLKLLFLNRHKIFSKEELLQKIVENAYSVNLSLIDVYVYRLRKILKSQAPDVKIINRKNFGYQIAHCEAS